MSQNTISALQGFLIFLQMTNAGVAALSTIASPLATILLAAAVGGFQHYVQQLGNASCPSPKANGKAAGE